MYSAAVVAAIVGSAAAQASYGAPASACPAAGDKAADGRYSCNPAHSYPDGQTCQASDGCYYLVNQGPGVTASASSSASVYVDVPEYRTASSSASASVYVDVPEYRTATSSAPSAAASCPATGSAGPDGRYSCNPAHSYPDGQTCQADNGCYYLVNQGPGVYASASSSASVYVDVPEYRTATSSAPAAAASCPATGSAGPDGRYSCNPAHSYPGGQTCQADNGCYYLVNQGPGVYASASTSASVYVDVPVYRTATVSAITTYCPQPTTFVHSASTYVVTAATTLTMACPGGCVVTESATAPAGYMPTGGLIPGAPKNGTGNSPVAYTGGAALATGGPLAVLAALGALFL
ncbi:Vacuole-localized protein [Sphaerulina musiva]